MYSVLDQDFPSLDVYLCYECGFSADKILMSNKAIFLTYQQMFAHTRGILATKKLMPLRSNHNEHFIPFRYLGRPLIKAVLASYQRALIGGIVAILQSVLKSNNSKESHNLEPSQ